MDIAVKAALAKAQAFGLATSELAKTVPAKYAAAIFCAYLALSAALLMRRPRKNAHVPPASYPLLLGTLFIVSASWLVGQVSQLGVSSTDSAQLKPFVYASIGAVACMLSMLLHHPSTSLVVIALAVLATLADAAGWSAALGTDAASRSVLAVNGAVFAAAYVVSRPTFVASFGPGVTLFSFVAFLPLAAVWASDPAQRTTILNRAALAASPFVLMLTGHPEYLHTQPHRRTLLTSLAGAASIAGTAYMHRGSPPLLLAAAVCLASAALLAFVDRTFPPVMGPFYSYERRSVVLSIICVTLVALQLASAQDHSAAASSSASVLPGFPSAAGPFLPPLLLMVAGYTLTVLLVGLFVLSVNSIAPASSSAYRAAVWDFGLVLSFLGAGAGVLLTQSTLPSSVLQAVGVLSGALPPLPSSLPPPLFDAAARLGLTGWSAAWHAAFAVAVTFGLGAFLHRALSRSTPLFSPIVADVLVRAPPTTKAAALTFSGSPSEATTPALLELLAARGAHATFFVTAEEAVKKRTLVMQIASAGHEVGLLGDEYPRFWTPWGVGSSIAAGQAAIAETLAPVASQVAHAADVARSQALLSAIHASHSSKQEGGRGEGLRRRRAASAAVGSAGGAAAAAAVSASDDNDGSGSGPSSGPSSPISSGPGAVASQPAWYRPADGSRAANELRAANARGLGVALWSACPYDWDASREEVAARLAAQLDAQSAGPADVSRGANGAVIALQHTLPAYLETPQAAHRPPHDVVAATAVALDVLSARGVASFVTLSALSPSIGRAAPTELFPT